MGESNGAVQALAAHRAQMSVLGYGLPWTWIVNTKPSPHDLHALITPLELLNLLESGCGAMAVGSAYLFLALSFGGASMAEP
jgi:hypothetical protein